MAAKQFNSSIKTIALTMSAVLAATFALVSLASLLLVGSGESGSLVAALSGIEWNTIIGLEIGLLGIGVASFVIVGVLAGAIALIKHLFVNQAISHEPPSQSTTPLIRSTSFRLYIACLILPAVILTALKVFTPIVASSITNQVASAKAKSPVAQIKAVNMGPKINTAYREAEPTFTADGRTMYFNCHNADICVSHLTGSWEGGNWSTPEIVGAPISTEYEEVEPLINATGDKLYFNSNRPSGRLESFPFLSPVINILEVANTITMGKFGDSIFNGLGMGHVWVSYRINGVWSDPRNINDVPGEPPVNSSFHDHCLSFSADGKEAFWTSTRPGGYGGNDIWTSRRVNGKWTAPENLGPNVNSRSDEHHSVLTPDGRSLFITSNRPGGHGGDDIYVTMRGDDGKWGPLGNLGPQVNGPRDDRCLVWTPDIKIFLFDSETQPGFGGRDIWWIYAENLAYPITGASVSASH